MCLVMHKVSLHLQGCGLQFLQTFHLVLIDLPLILLYHHLCLGIECVSLSRVFLLISGLHRVILILLYLEDFKVHIDPKGRQNHLDLKGHRDTKGGKELKDHKDPKGSKEWED